MIVVNIRFFSPFLDDLQRREISSSLHFVMMFVVVCVPIFVSLCLGSRLLAVDLSCSSH